MSTAAATPRWPGLRAEHAQSLVDVQGLEKAFSQGRNRIFGRNGPMLKVIDQVSFDIARGETFGLVGESGCGKSTIARCVLRLLEPSGGRVLFDQEDLAQLSRTQMQRLRRRMQIVFQDPYASLDPRMSVEAIIEEPLVIHRVQNRDERFARVREILSLVGLTAEQAERRPHAFSGGQRKRIGIARALVLNPELVILDEPVSALDVSIQAQVLNLLRDLQAKLNLTYLFIVHDLTIAEYFCDRLAVLYLGKVMELADREMVFREP